MASYPFTWTNISQEERDERAKMYKDIPGSRFIDMKRCDQDGLMMPSSFVDNGEDKKIWGIKPQPDDVWIVTYPKCGTTMTQELVWQMINLAQGGCLDSDKSKMHIFLRVPFVEMGCLRSAAPTSPPKEMPEMDQGDFRRFSNDPIGYTEQLESPRVIKTHIPISHLHPKLVKTSKVVVVMRNPKDCAASMFHHERLLPNHNLKHDFPFDNYAKNFAGQAGTTPIYGDYWAWIKDALKHEECEPNVKVVWFEDMKRDLASVVESLGDFIGYKVPPNALSGLLSHMHIDNFRKNDAVNMKPPPGSVPDEVRENFTFIRKGVAGDGKGHFKDPAVEGLFDKWVNENNKDKEGNVIGHTAV